MQTMHFVTIRRHVTRTIQILFCARWPVKVFIVNSETAGPRAPDITEIISQLLPVPSLGLATHLNAETRRRGDAATQRKVK
jgi:hypothetical protein